MEKLKIDLLINKKIIEPYIFLFKYIHPNIISLFGIVLNYTIFNLYYKNYNKVFLIFLTIWRIYCDNLDGMVARKFNKTSKIGGLLDSIDDMILCTIMCYMISYKYIPLYAFYLSISFGLCCTYYLYSNNSLILHSNFFEKKETSFIDKIAITMGNNTYIIAFLWSLLL
jgi:phosphatidylglycerophosphate synthase